MSLYESGIRPAFDQHLLELSKQKRDYGDYWSASSAGYCMRKNIFDRLIKPVDEDPRKQRVFTAGDIFHEWAQGITKQAGLSIAQEVQLQDEDLIVRGHIDDLIKLDDNLILYDYKSVSSRSFNYKKEDKPSLFHKMQVGTYMYMLRRRKTADGDEIEYPVAEARILSISKDDLRMMEQQVLWSSQLEKSVVSYWRTIQGYWDKKTLPRCTCADNEGGFMAKPAYNPYFYLGEPCSEKWFNEQGGWQSNSASTTNTSS